jgi:transcriptional regulator with XRE-family HTH domain
MGSKKMPQRRGPRLKERKTTITGDLTKAREDANLTQDAAGKLIGKDKTFICRLERSSKTPPAPIIRALAIKYGLSPKNLLKKAGHEELPWLDIIKQPDNSPDTILDERSPEETRELKRYLAFMRVVNS